MKARIIQTPNKAMKRLSEISKDMKNDKVKVGFPKNSNAYPDGTSVIMVGAVHEFGSPLMGVPSRSFIRTTLVENRKKYIDLMKQQGKLIISNVKSEFEALQLIGLMVESDIKQKIFDIKSPGLLYREGNPLYDTGHMLESVTHVVGKNNAN